MDLPDSDKISVNYITGNMEDSDCKDIYETITVKLNRLVLRNGIRQLLQMLIHS